MKKIVAFLAALLAVAAWIVIYKAPSEKAAPTETQATTTISAQIPAPVIAATSTKETAAEVSYEFSKQKIGQISAEDYFKALSKDRTLTPSDELTRAAQKRADEMVVFSHSGSLWKSYLADSSFSWEGENLYGGIETADQIETRFMQSPTHKANITNKHYTHVGIAIRHLDKPILADDGSTVEGDIVVVFFGGK